jgi:hypothetical protein
VAGRHIWAVNDFDPLRFHIPNDNMPKKEIWLQVTFLSTPPLAFGISITSPSQLLIVGHFR